MSGMEGKVLSITKPITKRQTINGSVWEVKVRYKDEIGIGLKKLKFNNKDDAKKVKEGYTFNH